MENYPCIIFQASVHWSRHPCSWTGSWLWGTGWTHRQSNSKLQSRTAPTTPTATPIHAPRGHRIYTQRKHRQRCGKLKELYLPCLTPESLLLLFTSQRNPFSSQFTCTKMQIFIIFIRSFMPFPRTIEVRHNNPNFTSTFKAISYFCIPLLFGMQLILKCNCFIMKP